MIDPKELGSNVAKQILEATDNTKKVVVYSGRFQPFHPGHYGVYQHLVKTFGKDNVFIGTSDKVDKPKSPLNFNQKVEVMTKMFRIPKNKIVKIKNPYAPTEVLKKFDEETVYVTVVGQKDASRLGGNYFEKYDKSKDLLGYKDKGYIYISPPMGGAVSGTEVRQKLGDPSLSDEIKKLNFKKIYGKFDQKIFDLITDRLTESVVLEWIIERNGNLFEGSTSNVGPDDGPGFMLPSYDAHKGLQTQRHQNFLNTGWTIVKYLLDDELEQKIDFPIYPNGPVDSVSYFPAGDLGVTTPNNQQDIYSVEAYDEWRKHIDKVCATIGYEFIQSKQQERLQRKIAGDAAKDIEDEINESFDKVQYYKNYYQNLTPSDIRIEEEDGKIVIDTIKTLPLSKGIKREDMPQVRKKDMEEYIDYLRDKEITVLPQSVKVSDLKNTQTQLNRSHIQKFINDPEKIHTKPVIISSDYYILDGHHRANALYNHDSSSDIDVLQVDLSIDNLIDVTNDFDKVEYQDITEGLDFVICRECGQKMKEINSSHLRKHNITRKEYSTKYPNSNMVCEERMEQIRKGGKVAGKMAKGRKRPDLVVKNKDKDFRKKISVGVKKSYENNNELRKSRGVIGKKYGFGNKTTQEKISNIVGHTKPEDKHPFQLYTENVRTKTNENYQKFFKEIDNAKKRSRDFHLDHKYSIKEGFDNNIPVEVISHYKNLQILDGRLNESKGTNSSLTLNELITDIQNSNDPLDNRILLLCGGAYGHLNHPFDDMELTFGDIKKMIELGLQGKLDVESGVTEKTDGQALSVSYRDDRGLIAARNKGHLKDRGVNALDVNGIKMMFKGRGELEEAFSFAIDDLNTAIQKLSDKQKEKVFDNGKKFMALEIIYPKTQNVIPYGLNLLVFHGSMEYDETGTPIGEDKTSGRMLAGMIKQINQDVQNTFRIQGPPIVKLPQSKDFSKAKGKYFVKLGKLQREFRLKDNDEVGLYHEKWWQNFIRQNAKKYKYAIPNYVLIGLTIRWAFFDKSYGIRNFKKDIKDEKFLEWAIKFDKQNHANQVKENMRPFESLFLELGAEILENVSDLLTANPQDAVQKLRKDILDTVKQLRQTNDVNKIKQLETQLKRIQAAGGLDRLVPTEGIVFQYKGKTYKLTGLFAPINQLLGSLKYG